MGVSMKCLSCQEDMNFSACFDNPALGYAYNLYHCKYCGSICKEDVWNNKGKIFIDIANYIIQSRGIHGV